MQLHESKESCERDLYAQDCSGRKYWDGENVWGSDPSFSEPSLWFLRITEVSEGT